MAWWSKPTFLRLDIPGSVLLTPSAGWPMVFFMNGLLAICGICREIMS